MVKTRMSVVDIRAIVAELRSKLIGLRLANFYDLSPKLYLMKFAKPDHKEYVIIESGTRIHTTKFERDKSNVPSAFSLKVRKHIRTRRLEDVRQLGVDRIVDFTFGVAENAYHLIVEFYAKGNVILTDHNYQILILLRTHKHEESVNFAVRETYPIDKIRNFEPMTTEKLRQLVTAEAQRDPSQQIKQVLKTSLDYGPALTEHCLLDSGVPPNTKLTPFMKSADEYIQKLVTAFATADDFLIRSENEPQKGYVILKKQADSAAAETSASTALAPTTVTGAGAVFDEKAKLYDDFVPFLCTQFKDKTYIEFDSFGEAVDDFFSKTESIKLESTKTQQESQYFKKLDKVRKDQRDRINSLQSQQEELVRKAKLIEDNFVEVDAAIYLIASAVAQSWNWEDIKRVVKEQKRAGAPIVNIIHALKLESNQITLLLSHTTDDATEEDITTPAEKVDVDITLSAYANARAYYDQMKKSASKQQKTIDSAARAIKAAEKKSKKTLQQTQITSSIQLIRKKLWFEKFNWFISSENYLVLSGHDAQQNELLVKRYMKKGDIYVHADLHGASSCIIKNPSGKPIPPLTLSQAGEATVCRSAAWDAKIVTSAWWVYDHQVSKTAPTGEYLPTGSFMIRGKKNFLPPNPLVMGFAIMFRVDESCIGNHLNERRVRDYGLDEFDSTSAAPSVDDSTSVTTDVTTSIGDTSITTGGDDDLEASTSSSKSKRRKHVLLTNTLLSQGTTDDSEFCEDIADYGDNENQAEEQTEADVDAAAKPSAAIAAASDSDDDQRSSRLSKMRRKYQDLIIDSTPSEFITQTQQKMEADENTASGDAAASSSAPAKKKHMSAKERKLMKRLKAKGINVNDTEAVNEFLRQEKERLEQEEARKKQEADSNPEAEATSDSEANKQKANGEGSSRRKGANQPKRSKLWKDDEDDEERRLRMELLGIKPKKERDSKKEEANKKAAEKLQQKQKQQQQQQQKGVKTKTLVQQQHYQQEQERQQQATASTDTATEPSAEKTEEEEIRKLMEEEDLTYIPEEERHKLTDLDSLTGLPLENDVLLFALPVCGPYSALKNYKYRVKLIPGSQKRGKIGKAAIATFTKESNASAREIELLKSITDPDMVHVLISNSAIAGSRSTTKSKDKKAAAKQKKKREKELDELAGLA